LKTQAAAAAALLLLTACSKSGGAGGETQDKYAGLDQAILKWRTDIVAADPLCVGAPAESRCLNFAVSCKVEQPLAADDAAHGVTARVLAAITWSGYDQKLKQAQDGAQAAAFAKGPTGWTRTTHKPVNMDSCAEL
jgi:hypothetical protein